MANSITSATMRAWTHTRRGNPADVLTLSSLPRPEPASLLADEILVRVSDVGIFQGVALLMAILPHFNSNPWIPCSDFSGTIVAVGSNVAHVKPGDEVFGTPDPKRYLRDKYNGLLTEYAVLPGSAAVKKPANISMAAAAGVGGNGSTAMQLCELTALRKGQKVLVTAASSSTGSLTAQVARWCVGKEGTVVGTCSAANEELVKGLGVNEVIDYRQHPRINEYVAKHHSSEPFDAIIDIAGSSELFTHCPEYLKKDGIFLHAGNIGIAHGSEPSLLNILGFVFQNAFRSRWPTFLGGTPRKNFFHSGQISLHSLQKLSKLIEEGHIKGLVDSEWPMEDAVKAFQRVKTARARGKVIVNVST